MEATAKGSGVLRKWFLKLAKMFPMFRRSNLERELTEAKTRINCQKKRMERIQQRYDALDRQCVVLNNNVGSLRSRLCAAEQQLDACKRALQAFCRPAQTAEALKRVYETVSPFLDDGGIELFYAAQEITGFQLCIEFPHEDACGCFEFMDSFELLRYLIASEFGAVVWEGVPDSNCKKAVLKEVDESTPAYREFERQLYIRALERLGLRAAAPVRQG